MNNLVIDMPTNIGKFHIVVPDNDETILPMLQRGQYEPHIAILLEKLIDSEAKVLDIGANIGQHTVLMSKLADKGRVVAIEGSEHNVSLLIQTLDSNNCHNVEVVQALVTDKEEEVTFCHRPNHVGVSFISGNDYGQIHHSEALETVKTTTLDSISEELEFIPDLVKMDIEGSESLAIKGGNRIFKHLPILIVELNAFTSKSFRDIDIATVIDEIMALGYTKIAAFDGKTWVYVGIEALKDAFKRGAVIIDACFLK